MFNIIFDMDGTLIDSQRIAIPAWEYAGNQQGILEMGSHVPKICGMNEKCWTEYIKQKIPTINIKRFKSDRIKYLNEKGILSLKMGAKTLLDFLRKNGIKMAIASSSSKEMVIHRLNSVGILEYFDAIISNDDVTNSKPSPDCFLLAAEKLNVSPESCIVFEDTVTGIEAGIAAGMRCIRVIDIAEFDEKSKKLAYASVEALDEAIDVLISLVNTQNNLTLK